MNSNEIKHKIKISHPKLKPGEIYSWENLGDAFGFKPNYFTIAGGIIRSVQTNSVLLITHPDGANFGYNDYPDGDYLIFTGRGKTGDQVYEGHNAYVGNNAHPLFVFEAGCGPRQLKFLGNAICLRWWYDQGPDINQTIRRIIRFQLQFLNPTNQKPPV